MSRGIPQAEVRLVDPVYSAGDFRNLRLDASGRLQVVATGGAGASVIGTHTPTDAYANPTDAINSYSLLGGWNGATWDRLRTTINTTSTVATGVQLSVAANLYNRNPLTGLIWASNCLPLNVDGQTTGGDNSIITGAFAHGYNGATWDRLRARTLADGSAQGIGLEVNAMATGILPGTGNLYRVNANSIGTTISAGGIGLYTVASPFLRDSGAGIQRIATCKILNQSAMVNTEYGQQVAASLYGIDSTNVVAPLTMERSTNILRVQPSIPVAEVAAAAAPVPFRANHAISGAFTGVILAGPGRVFSLKITSRQAVPA